ncbi:MAG: hypothetical protein ACJ8C4_19755 [Gemmataceae bacterium]
METIHTKVIDGRVEVAVPSEWKDGTPVEITASAARLTIGITENEWRDDANARSAWVAWSQTFEPLMLSTDEERQLAEFRDRVKAQSIEAVRHQMSDNQNQ